MDDQSPSLRRRRLGHILRGLREESGMTLQAAAGASGVPRATLGHMETAGARRLRHSDLDSLAGLYKVDEETRRTVHELARQSKARGWWTRYHDVFGSRALPDWESEASMIRTFQPQVLPELLQTPDYAAAVFRSGRAVTEQGVARRVEARMARRHIFNRIRPPHMLTVLDEGALRRLVGGADVLREQLTHLRNMTLRHHVDVWVLPYGAGAHPALTGPFTILDFPDPQDRPVVHVETATENLFLECPDELEWYGAAFDSVRDAALSGALSAEFIEDVLRSLESG